ncbi:MAG: glycosyltransferase [Candidatus Neomarinimicrobiota bacterium]
MKISSYFSRTSVTVISSRYEAYGIVIVEAICCGSPIVATKVGGIPEIIKLFQNDMSINEKKNCFKMDNIG